MISSRLRRDFRRYALPVGSLVLILGLLGALGLAVAKRATRCGDLTDDPINAGSLGQADGWQEDLRPAPVPTKLGTDLDVTIGALYTQRPFPEFYPEISSQLAPWRTIVRDCVRQPQSWVEEKIVIKEISAARVVLIADFHISPVPALATAQVIDIINGVKGDIASRILAMEALPSDAQQRVSGILALSDKAKQRELQLLLHECWPWPSVPMVQLIAQSSISGWRVAGVGAYCADSDYQVGVEDWRRQAFTREAIVYTDGDSARERTDRNIVSLVRRELESGVDFVVVLVGGSHILTPETGLRSRLVEFGVTPIILVPYSPAIEIQLRRQLGAEPPSDKWLALDERMYRTPTMTKEVIAKLRNTRNEYWKISSAK